MPERIHGLYAAAQAPEFLTQRPGLRGIGPEIGVLKFLLDFLNAGGPGGQVKDAP